MAGEGGGGRTFQILTCPSREPVATRWKERPQLGAHATLVTAYTGSLVLPDAEAEAEAVWADPVDGEEVASAPGPVLDCVSAEARWEAATRRGGAADADADADVADERGDSRERRTSGLRWEESWTIWSNRMSLVGYCLRKGDLL